MAEDEPFREEDDDGLYDVPVYSPKPKDTEQSPWPLLLLIFASNTPFIGLMFACAWMYAKKHLSLP